MVFQLDSKVEKVGIRSGQLWKIHLDNLNKQIVQTWDAQTENVRNHLIFQRNLIPAHKHPAEKGLTRDPHDEIASQNIEKAWTAAGL